MTYTYSIYRQRQGMKVLTLFDGHGIFSLKAARTLLNRRELGHPKHKVFIVRDWKLAQTFAPNS